MVYVWGKSLLSRVRRISADIPFSWAHELCSDDNEERAIVVGTMNEMAYVLQAWLPLIVWKQVEAPRYQKGYITVTFLSTTLIVTALVIRVLHKRQNLRKERWVFHLHIEFEKLTVSREREERFGRDGDSLASVQEATVESKETKLGWLDWGWYEGSEHSKEGLISISAKGG